jgi:hypothetical protein
MTEAEWLDCTDPLKMLHWLRAKPADRSVLLLVCACIRRHWEVLADEGRLWVAKAEEWTEERDPDMDLFGDHWDGVMRLAEKDYQGWNGVNGAIDQLWCGMYVVDDFETLTGNSDWEAERQQHVILLKDIFGSPFRPITLDPAWQTPTVRALAQAAYEQRHLPSGHLDPDRLAVLADALEEAGCDNQDILSHLRSPGPHTRGCWAVDLLLSRE